MISYPYLRMQALRQFTREFDIRRVDYSQKYPQYTVDNCRYWVLTRRQANNAWLDHIRLTRGAYHWIGAWLSIHLMQRQPDRRVLSIDGIEAVELANGLKFYIYKLTQDGIYRQANADGGLSPVQSGYPMPSCKQPSETN